MPPSWTFGINVIFIVAILVEADGLRCLQCHSLHQSLCEDGRLAPNDCLDDVNSTHCVKMEAKLQMGKFVMRYCSTNETQAEHCGPDVVNSEHVRVCKFSCQTDGCNTAPELYRNSNNFILPLGAFLIYKLLCYIL